MLLRVLFSPLFERKIQSYIPARVAREVEGRIPSDSSGECAVDRGRSFRLEGTDCFDLDEEAG